MRVLPLALLLLAGCEQPSDPVANRPAAAAAAGQATPRAAADDTIVPCARAGERVLAPVCHVEQTETDRGQVLTLRHPDGGFRRLLITRDGRGVVAADGAQAASVTVTGGNRIEVAIAGERYSLPATVKPAR